MGEEKSGSEVCGEAGLGGVQLGRLQQEDPKCLASLEFIRSLKLAWGTLENFI